MIEMISLKAASGDNMHRPEPLDEINASSTAPISGCDRTRSLAR
jgi:hypothetical protein